MLFFDFLLIHSFVATAAVLQPLDSSPRSSGPSSITAVSSSRSSNISSSRPSSSSNYNRPQGRVSSLSTPRRAVFAHYMVGTITDAHAQQDIRDAKAMGLDGFALNVGDPFQSFVDGTLHSLFSHAEAIGGFSLYISMDVYASGAACYSGSTSCGGPFDYKDIFTWALGSSAYYRGPNGSPMISTFSSGGFQNDTWINWRATLNNQIYFIPDFDETTGWYGNEASHGGWYYYWGSIVDGLFSWESAWPQRGSPSPGLVGGSSPGDISPDLSVQKGTLNEGKGYMLGLSTLQYKNSYGANVFRGGSSNLPRRMVNILAMQTPPDFIQIQTWNDGPESHNIAKLWPEQNNDTQPAYYMGDAWDHTAWQPLITSFIHAWKSGSTASSMAPPSDSTLGIGALWYKTVLRDTQCPDDDGGVHSQTTEGFWQKPDGFDSGSDDLNWAFVLSSGVSGYTIRLYSAGTFLTQEPLVAGLNFGSVQDLQAGTQYAEILDSGSNIVMTATGALCVSSHCPDGIYNMNYQVVGFTPGGHVSYPGCSISTPPVHYVPGPVCTAGSGTGVYADLCSFTCQLGYCPIDVCSCSSTGTAGKVVESINGGCPTIGTDNSFIGLCNFACSQGYCPPQTCTLTTYGTTCDISTTAETRQQRLHRLNSSYKGIYWDVAYPDGQPGDCSDAQFSILEESTRVALSLLYLVRNAPETFDTPFHRYFIVNDRIRSRWTYYHREKYREIINNMYQVLQFPVDGPKNGRTEQERRVTYQCKPVDDQLSRCYIHYGPEEGQPSRVMAYTVQGPTGPAEQGTTIVFCPLFFEQTFINSILSGPAKDPSELGQHSLISYEQTLIHEWMHCDPMGFRHHIIDIDKNNAYKAVYGSQRCHDRAWLNVASQNQPNPEIVLNADNYAWMYANRAFMNTWGWPNNFNVKDSGIYDGFFTPGNDEGLGPSATTDTVPNCRDSDGDVVCDYMGETYDEWLLDNGYACQCTEDGCSETSPSCCASGSCPVCACNEDGCTEDSPACCADAACLWASG